MKKATRLSKKTYPRKAEREFWDTHEVTPELLATPISPQDDFELPEPKTKSRNIAIRIDADLERRFKVIAGRKKKGYQTLMKEFLIERIYEEEKRMGIV
jgi:uncharacterized protein (DUF4415 family)